MLTKKQDFIKTTTDDFDPAIIIGKTIQSLSTMRREDEADFIKITFSDDSSLEFYLNKNPDIFYMEPEIWVQNKID